MRRRRNTLLLVAACAFLSAAANVALFGLFALFVMSKPRPPLPPEITYIELQDPEPPEPKPIVIDETELAQVDDELLEQMKPPQKRRLEVQPPKLKPRQKKKEKEKEKKDPEVELEELPVPEEKKEEPEEEKKEEVQPPPDFELAMKMVEQPDELDDQETPEDYDYLSNINRDVKEQTRAEQTNLEKDAIKPELHQTEKSNEKKPGTANEDEIKQTEEMESQKNQKALPAKPQQEEKRPSTSQPDQKHPLLAMRELEHRDHKLPKTAHEALASEADQGTLEASRKAEAGSEAQKSRAFVEGQDKAYMSRLNQTQLEALYGKDPTDKHRNESKKQSKTRGVWADQRNHWQSPLENMVPEVQPGNQTALRSRKHPFARFIAQMHRKIHDGWAWGFLDQLDARARKHPLNDYELWSRVEIVIAADGTIEKVSTVRHSGKTAFDAAAREVVWASGPFPEPPQEIVSGNGKIYVHWAFHRDERACGTFGAQPFILDSSGHGDRPNPDKIVHATTGSSESTRRLTRKPAAPAVAEGPSAPAHAHAAPTASKHAHEGHDHEAEGDGESAEPEAKAPSGGAAAEPGLTPEPEELADDPKAKQLANEWLYYFAKGQIDKTVSRSSLPFYAGDSPVARTRAELHDLLATMSEESKAAGKPKAAKVYTAAGLRKVFGSVPAGVQEGGRRVYGLTKVGSEYVVLMLEKKFGSWRVVGVAR